jgi:hypothetical protein
VCAHDAAYAWVQNASNHAQALDMLPTHLNIAPAAALKALQEFAQRPRPQLKTEGLQQVIDIVWEAEGYLTPKKGPERYMDLSYMKQALDA